MWGDISWHSLGSIVSLDKPIYILMLTVPILPVVEKFTEAQIISVWFPEDDNEFNSLQWPLQPLSPKKLLWDVASYCSL